MSARSPIRLVIVDEAFGAAVADRSAQDHIDVVIVTSEELATAEVLRRLPDAIILGELPSTDTVALCRRLREHTDAPLIALFANERPEARVEILDAGADDVVTRHCYLPELMARVRAHVRRARGELHAQKAHLVLGSLTVDTTSRVATVEGAEVPLAQNELLALCALAKSPSRPLSRDQLLQAVHVEPDAVFDRSIDVIISRLRAKLGSEARRLKTIRGVGYMLIC